MDHIQPGECHVKNAAVAVTMLEYRYEPTLIAIQKYIIEKYGAVITEAYRPRLHINDVHGCIPGRGMDNRAWCYPDAQIYRIQDDINNRWIYDPMRPEMQCAIVHDNRKGGGRHLHLQVHPGTRVRGYV